MGHNSDHWGPAEKLAANTEYGEKVVHFPTAERVRIIDAVSAYPPEYVDKKRAMDKVQRERDATARVACRFLLQGNFVYALRDAKRFRTLDRQLGRMMEGKD